MYKEPLALYILELLLTRLTCASTKDQLTPELPLKRDFPVLGSLLVNDGVVVLEVGAEALGLEGYPQSILVHGVGVLGPVAKVVCVDGWGRERVSPDKVFVRLVCIALTVSFTEVFNRLGIFVAQDLWEGG